MNVSQKIKDIIWSRRIFYWFKMGSDKEPCIEGEVKRDLVHRVMNRLWENYSSNLIFISFFLLGFCNSAPFLIMLSAAHDLLSQGSFESTDTNTTSNQTSNKYECNQLSTGIVLLADVIPGICIKMVAPFFAHKFKYWQRLFFIIYTCSASFLMVALAPGDQQWLIFLGIVHASISSSFGEMTFLSLSTLYPTKLSLAAWAAGTGKFLFTLV